MDQKNSPGDALEAGENAESQLCELCNLGSDKAGEQGFEPRQFELGVYVIRPNVRPAEEPRTQTMQTEKGPVVRRNAFGVYMDTGFHRQGR